MLLNENFEILEINEQAKAFFHQHENTDLLTFLHTRFNQKQGIKMIQQLHKKRQLKQHQLEFEHSVKSHDYLMPCLFPFIIVKTITLCGKTLRKKLNKERWYIN